MTRLHPIGAFSGDLGLYVDPLDCLVICQHQMMTEFDDVDYAESRDACHEDSNGRLPHEDGYGLVI